MPNVKLLIAAGLASLMLAPAAHAVPTLAMTLDDGVNPAITLVDTTHLGFLNFTGSLGAFTINVSTGTGVGSLNPLGDGLIDLNSINISSSISGGTLTIKLTEYDLVEPTGLTLFQSAIGGTVGSIGKPPSTLTFNTFMDNTNTAFGTATALASQIFSGSGSAFSYQSANPGTIAGPYSETVVVSITAPAGSTSSFDGLLSPAPEPTSMAALGAGLVIMGLVARRRARTQA
jgi:hypothetical protein